MNELTAALTLLGIWAVVEIIRIRRKRRAHDLELARSFRLYQGDDI